VIYVDSFHQGTKSNNHSKHLYVLADLILKRNESLMNALKLLSDNLITNLKTNKWKTTKSPTHSLLTAINEQLKFLQT